MEPARHFNTAGPIVPAAHYHVPPLERMDYNAVRELVDQSKYFILHAPRQTGKTSALLALRDKLREEGRYLCVYVNVENAQALREDVLGAMREILGHLASRALGEGDDFLEREWSSLLERYGTGALREALARWCQTSSKPIVLLIDEIDSLVGDTLVSVLRQLRSGYDERPGRFPHSAILCGVRDLRDYRIESSREGPVLGGSAFNISADSLRLGDFSQAEVEFLLAQHTAETGQTFTAGATAEIWRATNGQPWLVNALARGGCQRSSNNAPVDATAIHATREDLIVRRVTHLDQLAHKLAEERVRRVVEPILLGTSAHAAMRADDIQYTRDIGLLATEGLDIANPIYREVIPRDLTDVAQQTLAENPAHYIRADSDLDVGKLLAAFQIFFRENAEHWVERFQYREAGPQLLLQAFLQRIINGGGRIEREYGLGRLRTDLLIFWPQSDASAERRIVIECKLLHRSMATTERQGVAQTLAYMDRCAASEGHLVIFDRTPDKPWAEKIFRRTVTAGERAITVWGS